MPKQCFGHLQSPQSSSTRIEVTTLKGTLSQKLGVFRNGVKTLSVAEGAFLERKGLLGVKELDAYISSTFSPFRQFRLIIHFLSCDCHIKEDISEASSSIAAVDHGRVVLVDSTERCVPFFKTNDQETIVCLVQPQGVISMHVSPFTC